MTDFKSINFCNFNFYDILFYFNNVIFENIHENIRILIWNYENFMIDLKIYI